MVLELRPPHAPTWEALRALAPVFLSYVLSFIYIAIYWNNHHHMLYVAKGVNGAILWANMALLFCLSLVPFTTAWLGESGGAHQVVRPRGEHGEARQDPGLGRSRPMCGQG